jgi:hypothetical protein
MARRKLVVYVTCTPEEAIQRILAATQRPSFSARMRCKTDTFLAWAYERTFRLHLRLVGVRNSFAPYCHGWAHPADHGAIVVATFGVHPLILVLTTCWFGSLSLIFLLLAFLGVWRGDPTVVLGMVWLVFLALFGAGIVYVGRWLARSPEKAMVRFLEELFRDVRLPGPLPPS